jgi:hypothetical protein
VVPSLDLPDEVRFVDRREESLTRKSYPMSLKKIVA